MRTRRIENNENIRNICNDRSRSNTHSYDFLQTIGIGCESSKRFLE